MCQCSSGYIGPYCQYIFQYLNQHNQNQLSFSDSIFVNTTDSYRLFAINHDQNDRYQIITKICTDSQTLGNSQQNITIYLKMFMQDVEGYMIPQNESIFTKNANNQSCQFYKSRLLSFRNKRNGKNQRFIIMVSSNNKDLKDQLNYQQSNVQLLFIISAQRMSATDIFNQNFISLFFIIIGASIGTVLVILVLFCVCKRCRQHRIKILVEQANQNYDEIAPVTKYQNQNNSNVQNIPSQSLRQKDSIKQLSQLQIKSTEIAMKDQNQNSTQKQCVICMQKFQNNQQIRRAICQHIYHKDCLDQWVKKNMSCPTCRKDFSKQYNQQGLQIKNKSIFDSFMRQVFRY